ncbi:hypothetical protein UK15_13330 [Streptomyces variegatus]|uniref:Uncharacterized protein n=1 Tax=Streptomyces variegatus TaxID=284040 RepID=A0A0M2GVC9_9ACTN|nr:MULTISPECIES: hypothetical protein [Streptomyces]KJK39430.1 hypothetical protein UK15_13330 [Streptomyces variegatus]
MDIVPGFVFILPAVIVVGWILSWWGARRVRWVLLSAAAVVSVLGVVIGWHAMGPPADPRAVNCSSSWACTDPGSLYLVAAGLLGFGCCLVLLLLTLVGEAILIRRARRISD